MMGRFWIAFASLLAASCGGAVEETEPTTTSPVQLNAENGPWGRWELVSLVGTDARAATTQTFGQLEIEALPGGAASARKCLKPHFEPGSRHLRCADASAYDCLEGRLEWTGTTWRFVFPNLVTQGFPAQGEVTSLEDDELVVRNPIGTHADGRFVRVKKLDEWKCSSSSKSTKK